MGEAALLRSRSRIYRGLNRNPKISYRLFFETLRRSCQHLRKIIFMVVKIFDAEYFWTMRPSSAIIYGQASLCLTGSINHTECSCGGTDSSRSSDKWISLITRNFWSQTISKVFIQSSRFGYECIQKSGGKILTSWSYYLFIDWTRSWCTTSRNPRGAATWGIDSRRVHLWLGCPPRLRGIFNFLIVSYMHALIGWS